MPVTSRTKIVLLAATAALIINPGNVFLRLDADEPAQAQEVASNDASSGLGMLLTPAEAADGAGRANVNGALTPLASQTATATQTVSTSGVEPVQTKAAAPGENPFVATAPRAVLSNATATQPLVITGPAVTAKPVVAGANPFGAASSQEQPQPATVEPARPQVDDSALRYYAEHKDLTRLGAEMRRLKQLYPDWQPPKDLFSPTARVDEQPLWDVYKSGDFAMVRARIAQMQSANPQWQPSDDLMLKLQLGETRALVNRAFAQRNWKQVVESAAASPQLLVCGEMQVMWNVGESFAQMKNYADAFDVYRYVLTHCSDPQLRLSTMQKATQLLPAAGTQSLLALGKIGPDGAQEFEEIAFDAIRHQLGAFIQNGDFAVTPSEEDLNRYVDYVNRKQSAADADLIGWYFYAQQEWKTANTWFLEAAKFKRDPKSIEGVILTLRNMDQQADALKVAQRYLKTAPEIARQYIEIVSSQLTAADTATQVKDADLETFENLVTEQKSALGAQALGWKYLDENRAIARTWFAQSVKWQPTEGGVLGMAVVAARAKDFRALQSIKTEYGAKFEKLSEFEVYKPRKPSAARRSPRPKVYAVKDSRPRRTLFNHYNASRKG